jgi:hypothetical protein
VAGAAGLRGRPHPPLRHAGDPLAAPASQARRDELAAADARDGDGRLEAVGDSAAPGWLRGLPAADTLRPVLLQRSTRTVTGAKEVVRRREKAPAGGGLPPGHTRTASPYGTDARWGAKRDTCWLGCKLHTTEACDDPHPAPAGPPARVFPAPSAARSMTRAGRTWCFRACGVAEAASEPALRIGASSWVVRSTSGPAGRAAGSPEVVSLWTSSPRWTGATREMPATAGSFRTVAPPAPVW